MILDSEQMRNFVSIEVIVVDDHETKLEKNYEGFLFPSCVCGWIGIPVDVVYPQKSTVDGLLREYEDRDELLNEYIEGSYDHALLQVLRHVDYGNKRDEAIGEELLNHVEVLLKRKKIEDKRPSKDKTPAENNKIKNELYKAFEAWLMNETRILVILNRKIFNEAGVEYS